MAMFSRKAATPRKIAGTRKPKDWSCASSLSSAQCEICSRRGTAPSPPHGSSSRSTRAITSASEAPGISFSDTSLKAPSMSKAEASARRSIQTTPKRPSSGITSPGGST